VVEIRNTNDYTLLDVAGEELRLQGYAQGGAPNAARWGAVIQEGVTTSQLPAVAEKLYRGNPVSFGELWLTAHEFGVGARSVPWSQVRQIAVVDGRLRVGVEGRWLALTSTPVHKIPNFFVLRPPPAGMSRSSQTSSALERQRLITPFSGVAVELLPELSVFVGIRGGDSGISVIRRCCECCGVCSQHAVVYRTVVEVIVPAVQSVVKRCLCPLDLLDAVVEFAQFGRGDVPPVRSGSASRVEEVRDLGQGEAGQFEHVDESHLFDGALVVEPFASNASGGAEQTLAFVETQGRRRQPGTRPKFRYRQLTH
jgi:hypothetical protein